VEIAPHSRSTHRSGKLRVAPPATHGTAGAGKRQRHRKPNRVDCVRIVHWLRNALAYVPKGQQSMVAAALRQVFLQPGREAAHPAFRHVADQLRPRWPKLAAFMDESEHDVLAHMGFPAQHRAKLHSTNPLERLNKEVKRRADVVGIFPSEASILRLIGAVLLEANDEWQLQHRYMQVEAMTELAPPAADTEPTQIPPQAA
jgi:putative transposase